MPTVPSLFSAALLLLSAALSAATEATPTPFSVLIDLQDRPSALFDTPEKADYPIWLESVEHPEPVAEESTVRLRLRQLPGLTDQLLLRLFFLDRPEESSAPYVIGWTETGEQRYHSGPLGLGLGLPASESLAIEGNEIDYLEITVPNDPDGTVLQQLLIASQRPSEKPVAIDLPELNGPADPFTASEEETDLPPRPNASGETFLFGRTRALLHKGFTRLHPQQAPTAHYRFTLSKPPSLGMVTFHLHHADPTAPPLVWVNGEPIGSVAVQLPDLADPGYLGKPSQPGPTRFAYTGWLPAQIAIPGHLLRTGSNTLSIQLAEEAAPIVLYRLEIQLKSH